MTEELGTIITFLGGGILGAAIHYVSLFRSEKEKRHSTYVHEQLNRLYGPLYFLSSQNEKLFDLNKCIMEGYDQHFIQKEWSNNPHTQESLRKESKSVINLANEYIDIVKENNLKIIEVLRNNYDLIATEDISVIQEFVIDCIRMNKEFEEERLKEIPYEVYMYVGNISYSKPEFLALIKARFIEMQGKLKRYH
ncbi:hypothetical protein [Cellvibrio sp. PSBB006]|uniref:hypothetical protein n=1 Tax=Cellvibrio sp. PSBB006 TaxID=1987723 RepID=UPI000B3B67EC|nr:hypothetical protein [Cellvibrio sp. PSBB006]ARU29536.1 hypothetical protein CBR65_20000 [Cellvibrio sp. PSBB006]